MGAMKASYLNKLKHKARREPHILQITINKIFESELFSALNKKS